MKRTLFEKINRGAVLFLAVFLLAAGVLIAKKAELNKRVEYVDKNYHSILNRPEYKEDYGSRVYRMYDSEFVSYDIIRIVAYGNIDPENSPGYYDAADFFYFQKRSGKWELVYFGQNDINSDIREEYPLL